MKTLIVRPGEGIPYQFHNYRNEFWYIESGDGEIWINDKKFPVHTGFSINILAETKHKVINTGISNMIIREMQYGKKCSEDDIYRLNYDI